MYPVKKGKIIISDLKQLWFDLRWVYQTAFSKIFSNWQISLIYLFFVFSAFFVDEAVYELIISIKSSFWDSVFAFGRWYGTGNPTLYAFVGFYLTGIFFHQHKLRDTGLLAGESFVFAGLITLIFKSFFGRWRPFTNHGDMSFYGFTWSDNDHLSFSSGHANVAFCLSAVLASTTDNVYLKVLYYIPAVITAVSRIYHNQHWLSDVVVGAMIAILITNVLVNFHKTRFKNISLKT